MKHGTTTDIIANGQKIEAPDARHFIHAENGRGSGFAIAPLALTLIMEHRDGVFKPQAMKMHAIAFWALDRRKPKCLKAARPLATFFHN